MGTLKKVLKYAIGSLLDFLLPNLFSDPEEGSHTGHHVRWKNAILYSRRVRARRSGDNRISEKALLNYWQNDISNDFYHLYTHRFKEWFLGPHQELIDQIVILAKKRAFKQMVEVGCGDGRVLEHCAKRLPDIPKLIGIDINPMIITANNARYTKNTRLHFAVANAWEWLPKHTGDSTLLLSYGGVMEYFSPRRLRLIFTDLAKKGNCTVALVEPVDPAHNLTTKPESYIFGSESSFSHNHQHLLERSGFKVEFVKELQLGKVRWIMILATGTI